MKNSKPHKSVTLLELLLAASILGLMVMGFYNIDLFSRYHVATSDKRAKVQNAVAYVLEHMAKEISKGIGSKQQSPIDTSTIVGDTASIKVWIDSNPPYGKRDPADRQIAYSFNQLQNQMRYYSNCVGANCDQPGSSTPEVIGQQINGFTLLYTLGNNYVDIQITGRWNAAQAASGDNPEVTLRNSINMPAVSLN